jgi:hypothetical protein
MNQAAKAIEVVSVLYQAIAAAGELGVPSGHLYAMSMNSFASVDAYESCIRLLVKSGLVTTNGHLLAA